MGLTEKNIWILIRYYDFHDFNSDNIQTSLRQVVLPPLLTFTELKSMVYSWADIAENNSKVIKIRQYDNCLIPLSGLFQGSSMEKPFIVEVVGVHQFCPVKKRIIPTGYINALKNKLTNLEKRVIAVENYISGIATIHVKAVEEAACELANCVGYLDRRLDELAPLDWKSQITPV